MANHDPAAMLIYEQLYRPTEPNDPLPDPDTNATTRRLWTTAERIRDALTAAGWRPPPPKPDGVHWRVGGSVGCTIYNPDGDLAGMMRTPEAAAAVLAVLNAHATAPTTEEDPKRTDRVVDPHHPVIANGITVAIVPCTADCPPEHFHRTRKDPDA